MIFNQSARRAISASSLLVSLAACQFAFAAAAPKAPVTLKPSYSFSISGNATFGLRNTSSGMLGGEASSSFGFSNLSGDSVWDFGPFGTEGFALKFNADMLIGKLNIGSKLNLQVKEEKNGNNILLALSQLGEETGAQEPVPNYTQNAYDVTAGTYDVHISHPSFGALSLGVDGTMSAAAALVSYSKQASELGYDYTRVRVVSDSPSSSLSDASVLNFAAGALGQRVTDRIAYRTKFKDFSIGLDYVPQRYYGNVYSVLEGSKGLGVIYETSLDSAKLKLGVSYASEIGLGPSSLGAKNETGALSSVDSELASWTRSGDSLAISAAALTHGFDLSIAAGAWRPYNDRASDMTGNFATKYETSTSLILKAGYQIDALSFGTTHVGIRHGVMRNVFQTLGNVAGNSSTANLTDLGVTQSIGNAELYAALTRIYRLTLQSESDFYSKADGSYDAGNISTVQKFKGVTGFVSGIKYSF